MSIGKRIRAVLYVMAFTLVMCASGYADSYYRALPEAYAYVSGVENFTDVQGNLIVKPSGGVLCETGFIFYPGGMVEESAYLPLLSAMAKEGVFCVIVKMPLHLAVLDMDAGSDVRKACPGIGRWYIGGHSLGGAMAEACAAADYSAYAGIVLLAAYGTKDISDTGLTALSLYGSLDGVLNREKYREAGVYMPDGYEEHVLEGGNHAGFGCYGPQKGDHEAKITPEQQIQMTAGFITDFIVSGQGDTRPEP